MAKKKKKWDDADYTREYDPTGSAATNRAEQIQESFAVGKSQEGGKRFNSDVNAEELKARQNASYKEYLGSALASTGKTFTDNDIKNYDTAKNFLDRNLINSKNLLSKKKFNTKTFDTKQAHLNYIVNTITANLSPEERTQLFKDASKIDYQAMQKLANKGYDLKQVQGLIKDYKNRYGEDAEIKTVSNYIKDYKDIIDKQTKPYSNKNKDGGFLSDENLEYAKMKQYRDIVGYKPSKMSDYNSAEEQNFATTGRMRASGELEKDQYYWNFTKDDVKKGYAKRAGSGVVVSKDELIDYFQKRGLSKKDATALVNYEEKQGTKVGEFEHQREAKQDAEFEAEMDRKEGGNISKLYKDLTGKEAPDALKHGENVASTWTGEVASTIMAPMRVGLERTMGVSNDYSNTYRNTYNDEMKKDMSGAGKLVYDITKTGAEIYGSSMTGGALNFAVDSADQGYYHAKQNGATDEEALTYGGILGAVTGAIYKFGIPGAKSLFSKAGAKGANTMIGKLANQVVKGEATDALGTAFVKSVGKGALKGAGTFVGISAATKGADVATQLAVLGDKSDYKRLYNAYKEQGFSNDEAWKNTAKDLGQQFVSELAQSAATGAVFGAAGAAVGGLRQAREYNEMRDQAETLKGEYDKYTADKSSPYFENVTDQAELDRQFKLKAKELHPDVAEGNEESFNKLVSDKERIEGILSGKLSGEARTAIDNWENFVNQARDILGLDRVLTTREREEFANQYGDIRTRLLETRERIGSMKPKSTEQAADIDDAINTIDNEIARVDNAVDSTADIVVPEEARALKSGVAFEAPQQYEQPSVVEQQAITQSDVPQLPEQITQTIKEIDEDNLTDRQAELFELGNKLNLPEKTVKSMIQNDTETLSPRLYANEFAKMYAVGKDTQIKSFDEALQRVPELRETVNRISPQAAGVAFSEGNIPSFEDIVRPSEKSKGRLVEDYKPTLEEATINQVLKRQAKATGLDIIVTDDMSKYTDKDTAQGIAFLDNGKVVLNKDTANILGTADHEILGHFGKALAPKAYKELANIISNIYRDDLGVRGYDDFVQMLKGMAEKQGVDLSESDAQEEAIAYGLETMAMNTNLTEKFIDKLQDSTMTDAEKKTILDKLKEFVKHVIDNLKKRLKNARVRQGTEGMLREDIDYDKVVEAKLKVYEEIKSNLDAMSETEAEASEPSEIKTKTKFSLSEPIEETKDLVAVHNIREKELLKVIDLGGFAMPSIAITKTDLGHSNYGDISVVFNKETIDPQKENNKVFSRDGFTPTFPNVANKIKKSELIKLANKLEVSPASLEVNVFNETTLDKAIDSIKFDYNIPEKYAKENNIKYEDRRDLRNKLRNNEDYEKYIHDLVEPVFEDKKYIRNNKDYFTNSGNPRDFDTLYDEYSLENVVKIMKELNETAAVSGIFSGVGELSGSASKRFKDIEQIKANEYMIKSYPESEYQEIFEQYSNDLLNLSDTAIKRLNTTENYFSLTDHYVNALGKIARDFANDKKVTADSIIKHMDKNGFKVEPEEARDIISLLEDLQELPTEYFEAKPQRAVGLDEIAYVIVPDDISKELTNKLKDNNIEFKEYEKGNEEQRKELLNDERVKFSMENEGKPLSEVLEDRDNEGNKLSKQQQEYFKDSKNRDKRDGRLLVMIHGTKKADFNVFDIKKSKPGLHGTGFYFTRDTSHAKHYGGEVYKVYLNIKNPIKSLDKTHNITKEQLTKFVSAIAENEDYGIENYGQDATVKSVVNDVWNNGQTDDYQMINDLDMTCIGDFVNAIKLFNKVNGTNYDGIMADSETVVWNPNQIKNIDNKTPTTNDDIRLSLKEEVTDRDIDKYKATRDDIGKALKLTKGSKLDAQGNRKLAAELKNTFGLQNASVTQIAADLEEIGTLIETKGIKSTDTMDRVNQFVTDLLKSEKQVDPAIQDAIRNIRSQKIYLSDKDVKQITDFKDFWKSAFGNLRLVRKPEGAMAVDEFFEHLKEYEPEVYNGVVEEQYPDASTLEELLDWIKTAKDDAYSLLDMYGDEAVDHYANEVLNAYSNAKVEDITNNRAKQRQLFKNVGEMVDTITGLQKSKDQASEEVLNQMRKQQSEINLKLDEQRRNIENKYKQEIQDIESKLASEKSNTQKQIKAIKEKARLRETKARDRRKATEQRQVIRRTRDRVKTTINKPTIKKYIPMPLQQPVKDLFNSIDLGEKYTIERLNKMRDNLYLKYTGDELKMKLDLIDEREFAFTNALKEFKESLEMYTGGKMKAQDGSIVDTPYMDSDTYFAPVMQMIDDVIDLVGDKSLMKMDFNELKEVSKVLRAIEKSTIERSRPQTFELKDENGKKIETYEEAAKLAISQNKKIGKVLNALNSHLSGRNTLLAMGNFNPNSIEAQFANQLDNAYITESKIKQDLHEILDPVISEKKGKTNLNFKSEELRKYGKDDLVDVGFKDMNGKPILLNHDSLIFEYLNLASEDNLNHIARGGETFPNYKDLYSRKNKKEIYGNGVRTENIDAELTEIERQLQNAFESDDYDLIRELATNKANLMEARKDELRQIRKNIEKELTDYDKKLIKAWEQVRDKSTDMLNEYWEKTFGYENFNEKDYWHISVDPNFIQSGDGGNVQQVVTNLSESGATISRVKGAGNPITSGSAIFAFDEYIDDVAKRIAYAGLQRDMNAVMRYKVPGYNNLLSTVEHNMPKIAENFENLQLALFGGMRNGEGSRLLAATRGLAARATLSPNLRVALAQVPSYLGTYRYTDGKAVRNAWLPKNRVKQSVIDKYTPLMYARGATGYSLETADLKQDTNKFLRGLNKADRLAGGWLYGIPNKMDAWTVRHTFGAYLDYARRMYPDLEEGTKEQIENGESPLYKKAAELFNEGTMRTQPMFNVFNKNALQLSESELKKTLTIFHTQPFQYLNLAIQDIMEYKYEVETKGKNSAKAKSAKKKALKALATVLGGTALFTLIKLGVDKTVRHKKDDLTLEDVGEQLVSSLANMFVLGSTLVDGIYALTTGNKQIYDFEIYGTQVINSIKDFAEATAKVLKGDKVNYKKTIVDTLSYLGIPAANIEKDIGGIIRNIEDYVDNGMRDYSNEMSDTELIEQYILGDKSLEDLETLGIKLNNDNKTKVTNAFKKLYSEGQITKDQATQKMTDSGLYVPSKNNKQPTSGQVQGKLEWWDIYNKYHDKYISANSNEQANIRTKAALMPHSNIFYHAKEPEKRLANKIKNEWKKTK